MQYQRISISSRINTILARRISHANKALRAVRRSIRASGIISSFSMMTRRTMTRVRRAVRAHGMIPSFSIPTRRTTSRSLRLSLPSILKLVFTSVPLSLLAVSHLFLSVVSQTMSLISSRLRGDDSIREEFCLGHERGANCPRSRRILSMNRAMSEIV